MDRLLITGAAGTIGRVLRTALREDVAELRLADREPLTAETATERCAQVDLRDYPAVRDLVTGVDAVVHLAAISGEAPFADVLDTSIRATFHVLEAARHGAVRRVVLASSNHATGMYPPSERVGPDAPPRPDSFYGVGKVCDEALGRLYVDKFGLEVACLRIGSFAERPRTERELATWISHRDTVQLVRRCLEAPDLGFAIVYGVSANPRAWWDNPDGERIGYHPIDDAEHHADALEVTGAGDRAAAAYQGGPFARREASDFPPPGDAHDAAAGGD
jgi:uronate dehydrogenase